MQTADSLTLHAELNDNLLVTVSSFQVFRCLNAAPLQAVCKTNKKKCMSISTPQESGRVKISQGLSPLGVFVYFTMRHDCSNALCIYYSAEPNPADASSTSQVRVNALKPLNFSHQLALERLLQCFSLHAALHQGVVGLGYPLDFLLQLPKRKRERGNYLQYARHALNIYIIHVSCIQNVLCKVC